MYEVYIRLRFDSPCLGNKGGEDPNGLSEMTRGADGNIVFSQVWWRTIACQGAESIGRHQKRIRFVLWTPTVDGTVKTFRRPYMLREEGGRMKKCSRDHEAFLAGDVIGIKALIPDDIPLEDFRDIMSVAGEYFGISPFGWKKGFGKFKVLEIARTRMKEQYNGSTEGDAGAQGESSGGVSGHA